MANQLNHSFSILHGPTPAERVLMENWIADLVAFVNDDQAYEYGTKEIDDFKVVTPEGTIQVQKDQRWEELLGLASVFSG
jgi:hypothetical protein